MDTIVRPPEAPPNKPVSVGTARPRWPRRVAIGIAVVLAIAVTSGLVWVANVEPLGQGHFALTIHDPGVEASSRSVGAFGVTGVVNTVRVAEKGSTFRYTVAIRNDGSLPVTIEDVGGLIDPATREDTITRHAVGMNIDSIAEHGPPADFFPFAPFRLDPGQEAALEMEVYVGKQACLDRAPTWFWFEEPVTYRILGITRHSMVPTGMELRIAGPPGC